MNQNSVWKIIAKNTFTLFNLVNVILAVMVAFVGSYKNMLFIGIAVINTLISIINEIRAKKIVDKLRLLAEQKPTIIREGKTYQVSPETIVPGDILVLSLGDQVMYDSVIQSGQVEVNESFITGEAENISKRPGDELISGSFITSGTAQATVKHVGADNFVTKLQSEAHAIKTADSKLFSLMNNIVKYISYTLIPIGALLLWARFRTEADTATAITSTVAALINMIPEGLILLTSSVLALATIRLSRKKVLVQDLYSIETLARVDTICLDKTGTLTTGRMTVHDFILPDGTTLASPSKSPAPTENRFLTALTAILTSQTSENQTTSALKQKFLKTPKNRFTTQIGEITEVIPFSSDRKYSGLKTKNAIFLMGAIDFLTDDKELIKNVKSLSNTYRTLAVVETTGFLPSSRSSGGWQAEEKRRSPVATGREQTKTSRLLGIIRLEDEVRPTANKIINYFYDNDIAVKIISGDDAESVKSIAEKVGIKHLRTFNLAIEKKHNYDKLVKDYDIFTRVTPSEKKSLIAAFKKQGSTVAMTGDGVNDILAMKEADVSIAIGEGSDAARRASKIVLLDSGFEAIPAIVAEGRQSINNLERSTSLFLSKTIYASILAVLFTFLPLSYPYIPIEMSLLNFVCIGFPGLALALEHNTERIKDKFIYNIKHYSVPTGAAVAISMVILAILAHNLNFSKDLYTTLSAAITFVIGLALIYKISRPLNLFRTILIVLIIAIMVAAFTIPFARTIFEFI